MADSQVRSAQIDRAAISGEGVSPHRRDPATGLSGPDTRADHADVLGEPADMAIKVEADRPLEVRIVNARELLRARTSRLTTTKVHVADGDTVQLVGRNGLRDRITIKVVLEAADDLLYLGPDSNALDARGFLVEDGDPPIVLETAAPIFARASGGFADVYLIGEEFD